MPKATAVFDADDSRLSGALARINGRMLALQSRIAKFAAAFIAVRAVAGVVTAGFDHFKQALDVGGQLNDLSANTGVAVGDLVVLQQEFANAGKSAEDIGPVFGKMAKSLQGGSADETIKKLGINLDELKKKTPAAVKTYAAFFRAAGFRLLRAADPFFAPAGLLFVSFAQPPVALKQSVAAMPFAHRNAELEHAFCRRAPGSSRMGSPPRA